jgi:crotonobetainyl-CoA:carnitine CoA-transferase CaiB-like acyl-CoA transferase
MVTTPVHFDRAPLAARPAPELGADNDVVLASLGYGEDEIIHLKVAGVVY